MRNPLQRLYKIETPRERVNFYVGLALPPIAFTVVSYFAFYKGDPVNDSWYMTLAKLGSAALTNIPFAPLILPASLALADLSVMHLKIADSIKKQEAVKNKLNLEQQIQVTGN